MENVADKISLIKDDVAKFTRSTTDFVVRDDETQGVAIGLLSQVKTRLKRIEDLRKEFTAPLNDQVKKINLMFKAQSEPLVHIEGQLKTTLKAYMDAVDKKAREEAELLFQKEQKRLAEEQAKLEEAMEKAKKLEEEAKKGNEEERAKLEAEAEAERLKAQEAQEALEQNQLEVVEQPQKSVRTENGLATRKLVWKWRVINENLLRKLKPELFILDEKKINKLVAEGEREIAGLDIYQESELAIKA